MQAPEDLRPKKRRIGEAVQAFEKIIDRLVPKSKKPSRTPKRSTHRPDEEVLWEAPDPR